MEGRIWADITDIAEKRTVGESIEKSLKDRDCEERDGQNRRKNIIIFWLQESKKNEERKAEDVKKIVGPIKNISKINFSQDLIDRAIILGKATEDKERPLLIVLKEKTKKFEIFQNLNKIRAVGDHEIF